MTTQPAKPVYVFHGKDAFLRDQAYGSLVDSILGDADRQLCLSQFDATAELAVVLDELRTLPFLAPHRVVVVRNAETFIAANRDSLEKYLDKPASSGTLILLVASLDSRTRLAKKIPTIGEIIACNSPEGPELVRWIIAAAGNQNKTIDSQAANQLAQWVGPDLAALNCELEKLATYVGQRGSITAADISAIVTATASPEAFALANALTVGNATAGLEAVGSALRTRGAEFQLLGQVAWHIRRALQVQQGIEAGQSAGAAMTAARVFYNKSQFQALLKRRSRKQFQADMRQLIAADLAMKSGVKPKAAMQQLVVKLCN